MRANTEERRVSVCRMPRPVFVDRSRKDPGLPDSHDGEPVVGSSELPLPQIAVKVGPLQRSRELSVRVHDVRWRPSRHRHPVVPQGLQAEGPVPHLPPVHENGRKVRVRQETLARGSNQVSELVRPSVRPWRASRWRPLTLVSLFDDELAPAELESDAVAPGLREGLLRIAIWSVQVGRRGIENGRGAGVPPCNSSSCETRSPGSSRRQST